MLKKTPQSLPNINKTLKNLAEEGERSFLAGAQWRVLRALKIVAQSRPKDGQPLAEKLKIDETVIYKILHPSRLVEVTLPVEYKGKTYMCLGVRVWFDNGQVHKPGEIVKGGIRFISVEAKEKGKVVTIVDEKKARELMLDDVMALGLEMLAKNSGTDFSQKVLRECRIVKKRKKLASLDLVGGSKGVIVAPRSLHLPDHDLFVRKALEAFGYKLGLLGIIGWDRDVPAGDIGTTGKVGDSSVLDGFVDGYEKALKDLKVQMPRNLITAVITGKTANRKYQGNPARATATGFGTVEALRVWAESKGKKMKDLVVVFDGAGNVALSGAKFLIASGIKVIGMTDSRSVIMAKKGFSLNDLEGITNTKAKRESLAEWAKDRDKVEILTSKSEDLDNGKAKLWQNSGMNVLFVSSDAMIINAYNVGSLPKEILIVDGANGPVTPMAEKRLSKRKIDHLTGSYANSGGVICSLIEWAANVGNLEIGKEETESYIRHCLRKNFNEMKKLVDKRVVNSLADAFYYMAMERFVEKWIR